MRTGNEIFPALFVFLLLFLSVASGSSVVAGELSLESLKQMSATKAEKEQNEISFVRLDAIKKTAISIGARAGLMKRGAEYLGALEAHGADLDRIFHFNALYLKDGVLPPVIQEASDAVTQERPDMLRRADKVYRIDRPARFVTITPTWRDYLFAGFYDENKVDRPHETLLPQNDPERQVWERNIEQGWTAGISQADEIFKANMARLVRDYEGMFRYNFLFAKGMVIAPEASATHSVTSGNPNEMYVNDAVYAITRQSGLELDASQWRTIVRKEGIRQ